MRSKESVLQIIIKIWKNKFKILEGLKNKVFKKKYVEKIYNERMEICKACPFIDNLGVHCYVPDTNPCCSKCGCNLNLKLRSLSSSCGDEENPRWNSVEKENN